MTDRKNSIIIGRACTGKTQNFIVPTIKYVCTNNKENMVIISPKDDIKKLCVRKLQEYGYSCIEVSTEEAQNERFFAEFYKNISNPNAVFINDISLINSEVMDNILCNFMNTAKAIKHDHIRIFIDELNTAEKVNILPEFIENSKNCAYSIMMATLSVSLLDNGRIYRAKDVLNSIETIIYTDEREKRKVSDIPDKAMEMLSEIRQIGAEAFLAKYEDVNT